MIGVGASGEVSWYSVWILQSWYGNVSLCVAEKQCTSLATTGRRSSPGYAVSLWLILLAACVLDYYLSVCYEQVLLLSVSVCLCVKSEINVTCYEYVPW